MKLAVIGSRTFEDKARLYAILDRNISKITMIVSGGARGADQFAEDWAIERGVSRLIHIPKWTNPDGTKNYKAGFERNELIIRDCDKVLAFWDNSSRGTKNSIDLAKAAGKEVVIVNFQ